MILAMTQRAEPTNSKGVFVSSMMVSMRDTLYSAFYTMVWAFNLAIQYSRVEVSSSKKLKSFEDILLICKHFFLTPKILFSTILAFPLSKSRVIPTTQSKVFPLIGKDILPMSFPPRYCGLDTLFTMFAVMTAAINSLLFWMRFSIASSSPIEFSPFNHGDIVSYGY